MGCAKVDVAKMSDCRRLQPVEPLHHRRADRRLQAGRFMRVARDASANLVWLVDRRHDALHHCSLVHRTTMGTNYNVALCGEKSTQRWRR